MSKKETINILKKIRKALNSQATIDRILNSSSDEVMSSDYLDETAKKAGFSNLDLCVRRYENFRELKNSIINK